MTKVTEDSDQVILLKTALQKIIDRSVCDPLGTSKVIDMRRIAQIALSHTYDQVTEKKE